MGASARRGQRSKRMRPAAFSSPRATARGSSKTVPYPGRDSHGRKLTLNKQKKRLGVNGDHPRHGTEEVTAFDAK